MRPTHRPLRLALALPGIAFAASACVHSGHDHHAPTYSESEPNDDACCADDFGVLAAGEFLSIEGFISDDGHDPFDGFAFEAWQPLEVEFRLISESGADLDLCLYDPQIDLVVDCYETPYNPEVGTAFILAGGVDFHLVVNAFAGSGPYTLEVWASPLYGATAPAASGAEASALVAAAAPAPVRASPRSDFTAYLRGHEVAAGAPVARLGIALFVDLESGATNTAPIAETPAGILVWMGNP